MFITLVMLIVILFSQSSAQMPETDSSMTPNDSIYSIPDSVSDSTDVLISDTVHFDDTDTSLTTDTIGSRLPDTVSQLDRSKQIEETEDSSTIFIEGVLIDKETGDIPVDTFMTVTVDSSETAVDSLGEFSVIMPIKPYYIVSVISKNYQTLKKTVPYTNGKNNYFLTLQLDKNTDSSTAAVLKQADTADIPWTISGTIIDSRFDLAIESDSILLLFDKDTIEVTKHANFIVKTHISGPHDFYISTPGYQPVTRPVILAEEEKQIYITIPTTAHGKLVTRREITVSAKRLPVHRSAEISKVTIPRKELQRTASTLNDPVRVLQTLPGVASETDVSARSVVRGGDVHEARVFLDGIPLLQPYHYGGVRSTFNQQALSHLTLYKTGFPAEMHNAQSALIDAYTRIPTDEKFAFDFDLNPLQYSLYFGIPLFKNRAGLSFSSQGSFHEQIFKLILKIGEKTGNEEMEEIAKYINIPDYKDFSAGISCSPSPKIKLFINNLYNTDKTRFTYGDSVVSVTFNYYKHDTLGNSVLDTSVTRVMYYYHSFWGVNHYSYYQPLFDREHDGDPDVGKPWLRIDTIVDYRSKSNILYGNVQYLQSEKSIFNTTVAWQKRWWDLNFPDAGDYFMYSKYNVEINQINVNTGWIYSGFSNHVVKSGIQLDYTKTAYDVYIIRFLYKMITSGSTNFNDFWGAMNGDTARVINTENEAILSTLMNRIQIAYKGKKDFINASLYCSDAWDITDRLHSDIGFRIEYSQADHARLLSPRIAFKYNLNEKNELLASAGLYTQNNYDIGVIELSSALKPEKVWHGALGLESKLLPWLTQKVDIYGKYYYDLASEIINVSSTPTNEMIEHYLEYNKYFFGDPDTMSDETHQKLVIDAIELNRYSSHYENEGSGKAYGLEYMFRYDPTDFWHGWISLSLSRSSRERLKGWKKHPFPLDRPLLISVNNYYRLPRRYEISLKYRYMSGLPYTSVIEKNNMIHIGNFNDSRYTGYQRLDIRFSKGFSIRNAKGNVYTEIWNAMNSPNMCGIDSKNKKLITMLTNFPVTMLFFGVECRF